MSNERVNKIAQELKQDFVRDANDNQTFVVSDTNCYANNLPEGITMETVEKIEDYNAEFIQASTKAFGELAIEALLNDPEAYDVVANIQMPGNNVLKATFDGLVEYNGKPKYGLMHLYEHNHSLDNSDLKEVQSELSKLALEKLEGKVNMSDMAIEDF